MASAKLALGTGISVSSVDVSLGAAGGHPSPTRALADQLMSVVPLKKQKCMIRGEFIGFDGETGVQTMIEVGMAENEAAAIEMGETLRRFGLVESARDNLFCSGAKMTFGFPQPGPRGEGMRRPIKELAHPEAFAESLNHFYETFEPFHVRHAGPFAGIPFFTGSELVAWITSNTPLLRFAQAEAFAQFLLDNRQITHLDAKESGSRFAYGSFFTIGPSNTQSKWANSAGLSKPTNEKREHAPMFNPNHPAGGLSLAGLDPIYTNMVLYILSAVLLFDLIFGW